MAELFPIAGRAFSVGQEHVVPGEDQEFALEMNDDHIHITIRKATPEEVEKYREMIKEKL
jgi:hypothetical protein